MVRTGGGQLRSRRIGMLVVAAPSAGWVLFKPTPAEAAAAGEPGIGMHDTRSRRLQCPSPSVDNAARKNSVSLDGSMEATTGGGSRV
jgi:hypothetical protein